MASTEAGSNPTQQDSIITTDEQAPLLPQNSTSPFDLTDVPAWDPKSLKSAHTQYGRLAGMLWVAEVRLYESTDFCPRK